ncbi:MAG TPA: ribosome maturation factor RimM [Rectinemataceae bacterium]|nr:ribosome maturation factor RimM [Rectinemataceae bacterium]
MTKAADKELLAVAKLGAPRGLNGFLKLHSYSGEYRHLKDLTTILVAPDKKPDLAKMMKIKAAESGDWGLSFAFEGYDTPEKARALTGLELFLPRDRVSPLKNNEWYIHDLIGMKLMLDGLAVGEIMGVLDGGADPLLEVKVLARRIASGPASSLASGASNAASDMPSSEDKPSGEDKPPALGSQVLVPFRNEFIGEVDGESGSMELLAGWLLE